MTEFTNTKKSTGAFFILGILAALWPATAAADDSSTLSTGFSISKRVPGSIIGTAADGKLCRYHADDQRIHCDSENAASETREFLAASTSKPRFSGFGSSAWGRVNVNLNTRYAFSNAESAELLRDGGAYVHCKLALQFQLANHDTFWVWHDEIRFSGSGATAYVDSNGDRQADFAVRGEWTGRISGTRRWEPVDPTSVAYTDEQMRFPARPFFGVTDGIRRSCRPSDVIVAELIAAAPEVATNITGGMRSALDVSDN